MFQSNRAKLVEISSIARRFYGLKLLIKQGLTDESKWFLLNREKLKFTTEFASNGLVLDIGAYLGDFTYKLSKLKPEMTFKAYEPVPEFYEQCVNKFKSNKNINFFPYAVTCDGRDINILVDGPRSKAEISEHNSLYKSLSVDEIMLDLSEVELLKMNIEGMEYECLNRLFENGEIMKIRYLLIQFHNFSSEHEQAYTKIRFLLEKNFTNIFEFKWKWELWRVV